MSTAELANRDLGEILKICKVILVHKLQCKVVCIDYKDQALQRYHVAFKPSSTVSDYKL